MPSFTDQMGRNVYLEKVPQRIISLVPSQTELLYDLGLEGEVVGITKFCVHPQQWFRTKTRIGGTKQLHLDKIKQLQPDFIIANKEENLKEQIEALMKEVPVWISDINNLEDALQMIKALGTITNREEKAAEIRERIISNFKKYQLPQNTYRPKACYVIWREPYMTVGGDTFINSMLQLAGFDNVFGHEKRYPTITLTELPSLCCDVVLLSSEPYPFTQKHQAEIQKILPGMPVRLVDGELFSWYGSRLQYAPEYFQQLQQQMKALY